MSHVVESFDRNNQILSLKRRKYLWLMVASALCSTQYCAAEANSSDSSSGQGSAIINDPSPSDSNTDQSANHNAIVVVGRRVTDASLAIGFNQNHNTSAITQKALLSAPAGISGLKMLESLPGFNVQSNDALGLYEFGNSVSVRAFNFQQIGFVVDGIPLGRSDQFGGSPIFRYVDNENTARVVASTGTGDVSAPSYASLGPIVEYTTTNPAKKSGATVSETLGSDNLRRSFVKLESGEYDGLSAYASFSKINSDLWRGAGTIDRKHAEGKIRFQSDSGHDLTFKVVYNDFYDHDVPSVTYAQYLGQANDPFSRSGRDFGYLGEVPNLPVTVPNIKYSNPNYNQYYQQAINQRHDVLYGLSDQFDVTSNIKNVTTLYYEDKEGYGVSPEAYATSLKNYTAEKNIIQGLYAPQGLQYGLSTISGDRWGGRTAFVWTAGAHQIEAGAWLERDEYHRTQARYNLEGGNPAGVPLLNQPVHLQRDYQSTRDTLQLNLKDTWSLLADRLKLDFGVKSLNLDYDIQGFRNPNDYINQRQPTLSASWVDHFLPQIGAVYNLTPHTQAFGSWSKTLALPRSADDVFSQSGPTVPTPEAETAQNFEVGYRINQSTYNLSLASYFTQFDHRIQPYASPVPGSTTTETWYQNIGTTSAYGLEFTGRWKPELLNDRIVLSSNLSYNVARLKDNLPTLTITDNRMPDSPTWIAQLAATYEVNPWAVVNVSTRYLGKRYTNLTNSESVPSFSVVNAYVDLGYDSFKIGALSHIKLRFNVDNLFDKRYLGTIYTTVNTPATFLPGPARTLQATLTARF